MPKFRNAIQHPRRKPILKFYASPKRLKELYRPVVKMTFGPRYITDKIADLVSLLDDTGQLQVTIYTGTIVTPMAEKTAKNQVYEAVDCTNNLLRLSYAYLFTRMQQLKQKKYSKILKNQCGKKTS